MTKKYTIDHLTLYFDGHRIESNGIDLNIDLKAFEVLQVLIENEGVTVTTENFLNKVWADKPDSHELVTSAIARIRKLFKMAGVDDSQIVTVHKTGYRFDPSKKSEIKGQPSQSKLFKIAFFLLLILLISSVAFNIKLNDRPPKNISTESLSIDTLQKESQANVTQLFILRHTEKQTTQTEDPDLSELGIKHAQYWKKVLQHIKFDRILTTKYTRNKKTADIIGSDLDIKPEIYHPMSFEVLEFIKQAQGQKVLIIGHSNTIPDMINRIIGESKYPPMSHKNYNTLHMVTINKNGDTSSALLYIEMPD